MLIGILQTGHAPDPIRPTLGDYPDFFVRLLSPHGFETKTWDVTAMEFPESPRAADGWLITGSRHGAYDALPWIPVLEDFIRDVIADQRPLVGICFGHQLVAQALGGTVEKHQGGWSVGRTLYSFEGGEALALNAWHQDQVTEPPTGARTIATGPDCAHAAFAIGDHVLTYQAHPEFGADMVEGLLEHRGSALPEPLKAKARATLSEPTDNAEIARRIAAFFRAAEVSDVA